MFSPSRIIAGVLGLLLLVVAAQAFMPDTYVPTPREIRQEGECIGDPIVVDFEYNGGVNDPWTCEVQCDDNKPRYIQYANGMATQCQTPPGCNDTGEDSGVTCTIPAA